MVTNLSACAIAILVPAGIEARTVELSVQECATQLGFSPEILAASGVSAQSVATVLGALSGAGQGRSAFESARSQADEAIQSLTGARAALAAEADNPELVEMVAQHTATLEAALVNVQLSRSALRSAAVAGLSEPVRAKVNAALECDNPGMPIEMRIVVASPAVRRTVEVALNAERRAAKTSSAVPAQAGELLWEWRSKSEVVAAVSFLESNLTSVRAAWATWAPE